jgi:hypothetical protein
MFSINISRAVVIAGCPKSGLPALDFRRANGLPDGTSNQVDLHIVDLISEPAARHLAAMGFLDHGADLYWTRCRWPAYKSYEDGQTEPEYSCCDALGLEVPAPLAVRLLASDPQAVCELAGLRAAQLGKLAAEWSAERDMAQAEKAAAQRAKDELARARELLAGELAEGQARSEKLHGRLTTVSQFLAAVPDDALRGTAKRLASEQTGQTAAALLHTVEAAATCVLFDDADDDADDDAEDQ